MTTTEKLLTGSLVIALLAAIVPASDAFSRFGGMMEEREDRPSYEEMQEIRESMTRTVENIENGVEITITSDDADVVAHLQEEKEPKGNNNEDVTRTVENIENGVKITITSDDAELVERIQENAEEGRMHKGRRGGKHGGRGLHQEDEEKGGLNG